MSERKRIRVAIVDDHPVLREGLASMIDSQEDMILVGEASTGADAIALYAQLRPDILLLDLKLPDISGVIALERVLVMNPEARVIVLTTYLADAQVLRALKAGVRGYLLKATLRLNLLDSIRAVHEGQQILPPDVLSDIASYINGSTLTEREIQVLERVAQGRSNKSIADVLFISEDTVKGHVRSIISKLSANDRTHAVTIALRQGIIDL